MLIQHFPLKMLKNDQKPTFHLLTSFNKFLLTFNTKSLQPSKIVLTFVS